MEPDINDPNIWEKNDFAMIVVNLCVNKEFEDRKKKKAVKKQSKKVKGEKDDEAENAKEKGAQDKEDKKGDK
jgi:hypothetical protein